MCVNVYANVNVNVYSHMYVNMYEHGNANAPPLFYTTSAGVSARRVFQFKNERRTKLISVNQKKNKTPPQFF